MSHNRRDRGSKPHNHKHEDKHPRARRDDAAVNDTREEANRPIADKGQDVYVMGSLKEPARVPGDFGRDIGDETDLWI